MSVTSGWGRLTWNQANWNEATTLKTGWGAQAWNGGGAWGQTSNQVITLTGQSISSNVGSIEPTEPEKDTPSIFTGTKASPCEAVND